LTEAEYTFRLHKPIIPLRLEGRYCPDGWLGALCGNNLIYDFSVPVKYEDSFHGLLSGLTRYGNGNADPAGFTSAVLILAICTRDGVLSRIKAASMDRSRGIPKP